MLCELPRVASEYRGCPSPSHWTFATASLDIVRSHQESAKTMYKWGCLLAVRVPPERKKMVRVDIVPTRYPFSAFYEKAVFRRWIHDVVMNLPAQPRYMGTLFFSSSSRRE